MPLVRSTIKQGESCLVSILRNKLKIVLKMFCKSPLWAALWACPFVLFGQSNLPTANDFVPPYYEQARYGTNLGYYSPAWPDAALADIAAGRSDLGIAGAGVNSLRVSLPAHFLDRWGYGVELSDFAHYQSVGMSELTVFLDGPADYQRSNEQFCPEEPSRLFANLYLPIWVGDSVNEQNHYAKYVYETALHYGHQVRFWEVVNEPDYTSSSFGWKPRGQAGNWYENTPSPCDLKNVKAPIYHYIRMLRITYEVVKRLYPEAYVSVGGLGYPSFLDALLRHTDNPDGGVPTADYPLGGGAYFDALSYHAYPHNDGSMRAWDSSLGDFRYSRHSDAAVQGVLDKKLEFEAVLEDYGYGSGPYPAKRWIITECNIPRQPFGDQMGSVEGQRNFMLKIFAKARLAGIDQLYTYALADVKPEQAATNGFQLMGLYGALADLVPGEESLHPSGMALKTITVLLGESRYDSARTQAMDLTASVDGVAFADAEGKVTYVLWAKTEVDESEVSSAVYAFPSTLETQNLERMAWDYSETSFVDTVSSQQIVLSGSPVFLRQPESITENQEVEQGRGFFDVYPNPADTHLQFHFTLPVTAMAQLGLYSPSGQQLRQLPERAAVGGQPQSWSLDVGDLPSGLYVARLKWAGGQYWAKVVIR